MDIFYALAEPTRRKILELLADKGELTATEIYANFAVSPPAISQHLKVLRQANLVSMKKRAQQHIYQINPQAVLELEDWAKRLARLWDQRFDALDRLVKIEQEKNTKKLSGGKEK